MPQYAAVDLVKRNILLGDVVDFDCVNNVLNVDQALQNETSKLSSYYLKLCKAYSENNSIPENIDHIVKFIEIHPELMGKMPTSYNELFLFYIKCQVMIINLI